ncbi:MAG TPA: sulfate adenylyltransferase [Dehalococcoidia bacterium]|nr:sulfate adenylyltransferase [Dehalococcoidia bacterium]
MADGLISPHGGTLVNRIADGAEAQTLSEKAKSLPSLALSMRPLSDLEMIAVGAFSPNTGFMTRRDYQSVVEDMHLSGGAAWSLPVTVSASKEQAKGLEGKQIALTDEHGNAIAVMDVEETFEYDKKEEARQVYRTEEEAHPGVAAMYAQGDVLLGGPVKVFKRQAHSEFLQHRRDPKQTRATFAEKGWKTIVGFQTRNPVHRAHEYIQKVAMETVDALLLHPLVGATKDDDTPAEVRMACYEALLASYYPANRVLLSVFPAAMRYAGPREAIFHALVRKNYGCSHFIVGRDHAGVGSYYGTYDAQQIFREFRPEELGITPMFFENSFFCRSCGNMGTAKTCPHTPENHVSLSGTRVREMLAQGEMPPSEFSRPEVAQILIDAARAK